ncbi:hypothetical protein ACVWW7_004687 [Bradyrhizobium sp. LM6.9]
MTPNFRLVGFVANPTGCKRRSARFGALATELSAGAELGSLLARQRFGPHLKLQHFGQGACIPALIEEGFGPTTSQCSLNEFSGARSRGGCWRRSRVNIEHLGGKCDVPSASYQAAIIRRRRVLLRPPARSCLPRYPFKPSVSSCDSWPKARPIYRNSRRGGGIRYELSLANLGWLGRSHRDDADDPRRRPAIRLSPLSSPKQRSKSLHSVQTGAVHITRPSSSHSVR